MPRITKVMKRDGSTEKFDLKKLNSSIVKALVQSGHKDGKLVKQLAKEAVKILEKGHKGGIVEVQDIKDTVEFVLVKNKLPKAAKNYILYRYV